MYFGHRMTDLVRETVFQNSKERFLMTLPTDKKRCQICGAPYREIPYDQGIIFLFPTCECQIVAQYDATDQYPIDDFDDYPESSEDFSPQEPQLSYWLYLVSYIHNKPKRLEFD